MADFTYSITTVNEDGTRETRQVIVPPAPPPERVTLSVRVAPACEFISVCARCCMLTKECRCHG